MATIEQAIKYCNSMRDTSYDDWLKYCKEEGIKDTKIYEEV